MGCLAYSKGHCTTQVVSKPGEISQQRVGYVCLPSVGSILSPGLRSPLTRPTYRIDRIHRPQSLPPASAEWFRRRARFRRSQAPERASWAMCPWNPSTWGFLVVAWTTVLAQGTGIPCQVSRERVGGTEEQHCGNYNLLVPSNHHLGK